MKKINHHKYWIAPALIYFLSGLTGMLYVDGVRDYLVAYDLVYNNEYPLLGPKMASSFYTGPIWFYLLSVPLMISKSLLFLSMFVALLTSFKFYIAFKVGQLMLDRKFSMMLIFCMMLSSFVLFQQILFTHTNLIELAILYIVYYSIRSDDKMRSWFVIGVLFALAFHVHPTTGIASFWALIKLYKSKSKIRNVFCASLGVILIFLPIIYHEIQNNYLNIRGAIAYFSLNTDSSDYSGFVELIIGTIIYAPLAMYHMLLPELLANLVCILHCLILISVVPALYLVKKQNKSIKTIFYQLLLFCIFSFVFVFFIRKSTPWYMTYSIQLSFSLLMAISLWINLQQLKNKILPLIIYLCGLCFLFLLTTSQSVQIINNQLKAPGISMNNIRELSYELTQTTGMVIPAYLANKHGQLLCENSPVSIHGPYASLIRSHAGIEYISKCNDKELYYGPSDDFKDLFAVSNHFQKVIKKEAIFSIGSSHFYQPLSISKKQKLQQEPFQHRYELVLNYKDNWNNMLVSTQLNKGNYLAITKIEGGFSELITKEVKANGEVVLPLTQSNYSSLYYCDSCDQNTTIWDISYFESIEGSTNIVSF